MIEKAAARIDARRQPRLSQVVERIPLPLRVGLYAALFLAAAFVLLPWLAHRLDEFVPVLHVELPTAVRFVGLAIFAVLLATYLASSYWLTSRGRGAQAEFDPPQQFVDGGPFRWCRNPLAVCVVGMFLSLALWWSSTGVFLLFLLAVPLAHLQVIWIEEPRLRRRFGAAYEEYLRRVPRWLPRPPRGARP
jgi:protein-S-isoprenylcysteine O-methyltransferase Ste14